jgi:hypothetical protein
MKPLNKKFLVLLALSALLLMPLSAMATMQEVPLDANGTATNTISSPDGIYATPLSSWDGNFSLTATVTTTVYAGYYVYKYEYSFLNPDKAISHFSIGVSAGVPDDALAFWTGGVEVSDRTYLTYANGGIATIDPGDSGQPGLPASLTGVYVENFTIDGDYVKYTLYSLNKPVYQDFYAKDGEDKDSNGNKVTLYAYNRALDPIWLANSNFDGSDADYRAYYTIGPDTAGGAVPIPPTALLLGSGLLGLGLIGWRKRQ